MKILLIESGAAREHPILEQILRRKLHEAAVPDVEVDTAHLTDLSCSGCSHNKEHKLHGSEHTSTRKLLNSADLILVMAKVQRNFVTKFLDYSRWGHVHLFRSYCFGLDEDCFSPEGEQSERIIDRSLLEALEEGCRAIVARLNNAASPQLAGT